jgi:nitroreductase
MNVIDALHARSTVRAYKPDPVGKDTILKILKAATRAPSWANTQPWEIFVAGGEALERLRTAYVVRSEERVPSNPDLPAPQTWPPVIRQRMAELMSARARLIFTDGERDDAAIRQACSNPTIGFLVRRPWCFFAWIETFRLGHYLIWGCWHRASCWRHKNIRLIRHPLSFSHRTLILFVQN